MNGKYRLVYILGAGHCGSTLLNLLLNGHSLALGLSEVQLVGRFKPLTEITKEDERVGVFWQQVANHYEALCDQSFAELDLYYPSAREFLRWDEQRIFTWARPQQCLFDSIAHLTNYPILVDASKSWQRLYLLQHSGLFDLQIIHLVRDGRAVVNSYHKKYGDFRGLRKWMIISLMAIYLRRHFSQNNWYKLRYEDLTIRPERTLRALSDYLHIPYQPEMLQYRQHFYVGVGGNRMAQSREQTIVLDEKWRKEMSPMHRIGFAFFGSWLNKYYGY